MLEKITAVLLASASMAGAADASSLQARERLFAQVNGTCIGQSRMVSPEASEPIVMDRAATTIAVLLRERGRAGGPYRNVLCLYDKRTKHAVVRDYRWLGTK